MKTVFILFVLFTASLQSTKAQCWENITAGFNHTIAIKQDGSLWAWGSNATCQLGTGTMTDKHNPVQIGTDLDWLSVSAGGYHTAAIKANGTLWVWGYNSDGQLGDNTIYKKFAPTQLGTANDWKMVSAGSNFTMAIKTDGTLWAWGFNYDGMLGIGSSIDMLIPTQVGTEKNWKTISAGASHCVALKNDGSLWAWGTNIYGELGNGVSGHSKTIYSPVNIGTDTDWKLICAGSNYSMAIKTDGTLWTWGINGFGQLGDGTTDQKTKPTKIGTDNDWKMVKGYRHTVAVKNNGTLWSSGTNQYGEFGDGTIAYGTVKLKQVSTSEQWASAEVGYNSTFATQTDKSLWTSGKNEYGQLGDYSTDDVKLFTNISCFPAGIKEDKSFNNYTIAPNPSTSTFNLQYITTYPLQLVVCDVYGKVILRTTLQASQNSYLIPADQWASGVYYYTIESNRTKVKQGKLMKL